MMKMVNCMLCAFYLNVKWVFFKKFCILPKKVSVRKYKERLRNNSR